MPLRDLLFSGHDGHALMIEHCQSGKCLTLAPRGPVAPRLFPLELPSSLRDFTAIQPHHTTEWVLCLLGKLRRLGLTPHRLPESAQRDEIVNQRRANEDRCKRRASTEAL